MSEYAFLFAGLAAVMLLCSWREYVSNNRRDARLMAAFGATGMLASTAAWLG